MADRFLPGTFAWAAYNLALSSLIVVALPAWLPWMLSARKRRANFLRRLGAGLPPSGSMRGNPTVWVHSVSVGETLASAPFVRALKRELPESAILLSTVTLTGQETASKSLGDVADATCFFPFDLPPVCRRFLDRIRPDAVVILETEIWPNFLAECAARGIPVAILNGRISERSHAGYRRFSFLFRRVLRTVRAIGAQSATDAARYADLRGDWTGIAATGNLKYDVAAPAAKGELGGLLSRAKAGGRFLFVAGSTHDGEETQLLSAFRRARASFPDLLLLVAPRHPERCDRVEREFRDAGFPVLRRSRAGTGFGPEIPVLLLDTVGELAGAYANADAAFVGGSLVPVGGHNILEPACFGVPVLTGPHMHNFREIASAFRGAGALETVRSGEELGEKLVRLLSDRGAAMEMGSRGRELILASQGATARNVRLVLDAMGPAKGTRA